ncbi:protein NO VEIN domain-containing protein [Methanoplanus limicola]|uniref:Uncharacterized protein family UPF0150 n=1 Tax=Methanoplanus limicola DSM 2279 TaxID=937775 RepID=H1YYL2_9EURY|nr:DUF3883 domain-containing protein [Methanoplanus limicola]EHQ35995.1 Uncharacterized protein family UPF0150 [Methanoplanus limicola DSM 2279]
MDNYLIVIEEAGTNYSAYSPDVLGCVSTGRTPAEAESNIREALAHIKAVAMKAVMDAEESFGHIVTDVSAEKCGWDVTSVLPSPDGGPSMTRHIEVKGRAKGQTTITVSRNEIMYGLNQSDKFILAVVIVNGDSFEGPFYVREPFDGEPGWAVTSVNLDLQSLLDKAETSGPNI